MRITYVQTAVLEDELKKLLEKAKTNCKKDALRMAIEHYIKCPYVNED